MATWWFKGRNTRDLVQSKMLAFPSLSKRMLKRNRQEEEANTSSASSSPSVSNRCRHGYLRRHHKHRHVHSSPATDITTLEVSIHSESGQPVTRVVRPQGRDKLLIGKTSIIFFSELPLETSISKRSSPRPRERRDMRRRIQKPSGYKLQKVNPRDYDIKFDTEAYLHSDRIKEIMNMESLEKTLDEVLTISSDEMDQLLTPSRKESTFSNLSDPLISSRRESVFSTGNISYW